MQYRKRKYSLPIVIFNESDSDDDDVDVASSILSLLMEREVGSIGSAMENTYLPATSYRIWEKHSHRSSENIYHIPL